MNYYNIFHEDIIIIFIPKTTVIKAGHAWNVPLQRSLAEGSRLLQGDHPALARLGCMSNCFPCSNLYPDMVWGVNIC